MREGINIGENFGGFAERERKRMGGRKQRIIKGSTFAIHPAAAQVHSKEKRQISKAAA